MGIAAGSFVLAALASSATKIANQWEKAIVLRLGRFRSMKGPGLFFIIPIVDTVPYWIDIRVITSSFKASQPHCRRAKRPDKSSE
jgi:regulator of protease activity HflC (stomatin/prohibitin superfamily)